jgi:hypothetical protein
MSKIGILESKAPECEIGHQQRKNGNEVSHAAPVGEIGSHMSTIGHMELKATECEIGNQQSKIGKDIEAGELGNEIVSPECEIGNQQSTIGNLVCTSSECENGNHQGEIGNEESGTIGNEASTSAPECEIEAEQYYIGSESAYGDDDDDDVDDYASEDEDGATVKRGILVQLASSCGWGDVKFHVRRARRGNGWQGCANFTSLAETVTGVRAGTKKEAMQNVLDRACRWAVEEAQEIMQRQSIRKD